MARLARAVFPGLPHHVTQRGNGRARTFFSEVLMPNHVHLILVPSDPDGIRRTLAPVHRRYAGHVHARLKRTGHFWQGRFGCVAMDEDHLGAAIRYVALSPVRARLVDRAADWRWSSVRVHLGQADEGGLTAPSAVRERFPDFVAMLAAGEDDAMSMRLRKAKSIGRPVGDARFLSELEARAAMRPRSQSCAAGAETEAACEMTIINALHRNSASGIRKGTGTQSFAVIPVEAGISLRNRHPNLGLQPQPVLRAAGAQRLAPTRSRPLRLPARQSLEDMLSPDYGEGNARCRCSADSPNQIPAFAGMT